MEKTPNSLMGRFENRFDYILLAIELVVISFVFAIASYFLHRRQKAKIQLPNIPWVGRNTRLWLNKIRARTWTTLNYEAALREAYENYAKEDKSCVLSGLDGDVIVLPPSAISWLVNQSDQDISTDESTRHVLQTRHTFPVPQIMDASVHFDVIKGELTRQVFNVTPEVTDELLTAIDEIFGVDTESWRPLILFEHLTRIISRTSNRVFVGLPLCRNKAYLDNAIGFAEDIALSATVLRLLPPVIRHILAPIVTIPNKLHTSGYTKIMKPEILRRQKILSQELHESEKETKSPDSNDFLSWLLLRSYSPNSPPSDSNPSVLIARMLHLNFASVHTTSFIATNAIFDLLSSPNESPTYISELRAEALSAQDTSTPTATTNQTPLSITRRGLAKMPKTDSALRESSRLASIIGLGANHLVTNPSGITAPDGTHCPYGSLIAVPSWGIHNDTSIYADPSVYQPFRFAGPTPAGINQSFTTTSPTYLGFGHGRHACPGRFFASQELKLLIAYLVLNYDMEIVDEDRDKVDGGRPKNFWAGPNHVPPLKARIRVKRRKTSAE